MWGNINPSKNKSLEKILREFFLYPISFHLNPPLITRFMLPKRRWFSSIFMIDKLIKSSFTNKRRATLLLFFDCTTICHEQSVLSWYWWLPIILFGVVWEVVNMGFFWLELFLFWDHVKVIWELFCLVVDLTYDAFSESFVVVEIWLCFDLRVVDKVTFRQHCCFPTHLIQLRTTCCLK